jgi:SAM-dependent methyltransferase
MEARSSSMSDTERDVSEAAGGWDSIVRHYEACLERHGATPLGVDWRGGDDLAARFGVMLDGLLAGCQGRPRLLDIGCGTGFLLDYAAAVGKLDRFDYLGVDLSAPMVEAARARWPGYDFAVRDVLADPLPDAGVDVILMNGVMTERVGQSHEQMVGLAQSIIAAAFRAARVGIAFNVMSAHVDWTRDDLFHWPHDELAGFLVREVSRHYAIRADYGLYEYSCFVWHGPQRPPAPASETWWER